MKSVNGRRNWFRCGVSALIAGACSQALNAELSTATSYNAETTSLPDGRLRTVFHAKWINYLDNSGLWRTIDPTFRATEYGFEMTSAPFEVFAPLTADQPAVFNNNNCYDAFTHSVIDEPPLEQTIQALDVSPVAGRVEIGDLGWGQCEYVLYPNAYPQYDADLIYWVHQGASPRLRKLVRFNRAPASDVELNFLVRYADEVQTVRTDHHVTVRRVGDGRRGSGWASFYVWDSGGGWSRRRAICFDFAATSSPNEFLLTKHIEASYFSEAALPVFTDATATFYPDPDPGMTCVDGGTLSDPDPALTWSGIRTYTGGRRFATSDTPTNGNLFYLANTSGSSGGWKILPRVIMMFDTSGLPNDAVVDDAVLSYKITDKNDPPGWAPAHTVVSVNTASNTDIVPADYNLSNYGTTEYVNARLTYANMSLTNYNDHVLNATGRGAITPTGITKFGIVLNYDFDNVEPSLPVPPASGSWSTVLFSESAGTQSDPKLAITYTCPSCPVVTAIDPDSGLNTSPVDINSISGANFLDGFFPITEDFETLTTGTLNGQNGWTANSIWNVQSSVTANGTRAIYGVATSGGTFPASRFFDPMSDGVLHCSVRRVNTNNHSKIGFYNAGAYAFQLQLNGNNDQFGWHDNLGGERFPGISVNYGNWQTVDIELDMDGNGARFRIDGGNWSPWYTTSNQTQVNELRLWAEDPSGDLYVDDIRGLADVKLTKSGERDIHGVGFSTENPLTYSESFGGYSSASLNGQDGWTGASATVQSSVTYDGGKAVSFDSTDNNGAIRPIGTHTQGRVRVALRRSANNDVGASQGYQMTLCQDGTIGGCLYAGGVQFCGDGQIKAIASSGLEVLQAYAPNVWYLVDFDFDTATDQFRVRIDNGAWSPWYGFSGGAVSEVNNIRFQQNNSGSATNYFDAIQPTPSEMLLGGSFDITCAAPGLWDVVVTNPDGGMGTLTEGFEVLAPTPTVTAIDPDNGTDDAPVNINSITGSGFFGDTNTYAIDMERSSLQYLSVADSVSLSFTGDHTIEGWVKLESQPPFNEVFSFFEKFKEDGNRSYLYRYQDLGGTKMFELRISSNGATNSVATLNYTFSLGEWHHVAFVYTAAAGTIQVLVDGESVGTPGGFPSNVYDGNAFFGIGGNEQYMDGLMDDVRAWSVARSAAEIRHDMGHEIDPASPNLAGYWKLNNSLQDATAAGNHLTNNNAAPFVADSAFAPRSIDLEKDNSQSMSITDAAQSGLDGLNDFTLEWRQNIETSLSGGEYRNLFVKDAGEPQRSYAVALRDVSGPTVDLLVSRDGTNANSQNARVSTSFTVGTWEHFSLVYRASLGQMELFKNGVSQGAAGGLPTAVNNSTAPVVIGGPGTGGTYFDGKLDEIRFWNMARTAQQIADQWDRSVQGCEPGLVACWHFDNNLTDSSRGSTLTPNNFSPPSSAFSTDGALSTDPEVRLAKAGESDIVCTGFTLVDSTSLANGVCDITDAALGFWDVIVTNPDGGSGSLPAGFEVLSACDSPMLDAVSGDGTFCVDDTVQLNISATGTDPLNYRWRRNGIDLADGGTISGAGSDTLTIDPAALGDSGDYDVVVTNACGSATSATVAVLVLGVGPDCNTNGTPDDCDVYNGGPDCNTNGVPDECDLLADSYDCNDNGTPDECEAVDNAVYPGVYNWVGPDGGILSEGTHWDPQVGITENGNIPGPLSHLVLTTPNNTCVVTDGTNEGGGPAYSMCTIEVGPAVGGTQTVEVLDGISLATNASMSILAGGHVRLTGGELAGATVAIDGGTLSGHGRVRSDVLNGGLVRGVLNGPLVLSGASFDNPPAGQLLASIGAPVSIESPNIVQQGAIEVRSTATLSFEAPLTNEGDITLYGGTIGSEDPAGLTNLPDAQITATGTIDDHLENQGILTIIADLLIVGDLTNSGTVFIQSGTMTVTGSLSNSGTIFGGFGGRDGAGGIAINGDLRLERNSELILSPGTLLRLDGDFDVAIDDPARCDLSSSVLWMTGIGVDCPQRLEAMAPDVGPRGMELRDFQALAIGELRIGSGEQGVRLTNAYANSRGKRADAVYVRDLVLEPGATLDLGGIRLYYGTILPADSSGVTVIDSVGGGSLSPLSRAPKRTRW